MKDKPGCQPRAPASAPNASKSGTRDEEERVLAAFRPRLKLAFYLLLYTLQRPSDVLADAPGSRDGARGAPLHRP